MKLHTNKYSNGKFSINCPAANPIYDSLFDLLEGGLWESTADVRIVDLVGSEYFSYLAVRLETPFFRTTD